MQEHGSAVNDIARPTRTYAATWFGSFGLLTALFWSVGSSQGDPFDEHGVVVVGLFLLGLLALPVGAVRWVRWLRRHDRDLKERVERGSREVVSFAVDGVPLAGRVLRHREEPKAASWAASSRGPVGPTSLTLVATVLSDPPRRVVAAVPRRPEGYGRGTAVRLLVHPGDDDVAVLDDRAGREEVDRLGVDPRWDSEALPTDAAVMGGYAPLLLVALTAFATGAGAALLVLAIT